MEKAVRDDSTNIARTNTKTDNSPKTEQVKKEPVNKRNSQEKINVPSSHQQSNHVTLNSNTNALRSTNLQKLLQKDAANTTAKGETSSSNNTTAAAKGNVAGMLKDKQSRSSNENKLTRNKNEAVLRQQKSEPQERFSVSLIEKARPSANEQENPTRDVKASPSPKTPDITKSGIENRKSEEKYKVKKSLSPSLTALIEKDANNSQKENERNENKNVEVNGTSPPKTNENCTSKTGEPLDSWGAFELKLQNKVKQSAERSKRGTRPNTRGSLNTRGDHDKRGSESENVTILIEDTTNAGKELKKIGRTVSSESRDSIDGKLFSPEKIKREMISTAAGRNYSPEDGAARTSSEGQVKLSVDGDQITISSVRARKNSFLTSEDSDSDGGKNTNERKRVPSFSLSDDPKTVVIEGDTPKHSNGIKSGHETSGHRKRVGSFHLNDEQNTVIIENDILPHSLSTKETSVSRTVSQSSTNSRVSNSSEGKSKRVLNLSREASLDNAEPKLTSSSFGRSETEQSLTGGKNEVDGENRHVRTLMKSGKQKGIEISESVKTSKSKDESVKVSGRVIPKILLADLLAKDDTSSQDTQGRAADTEQSPADSANLYKDKLKGLKKTTTYYASEPITLGDRGNSSGKQGKADTKSCSLPNGLGAGSDSSTSEANSTDVNNNLENKDISHTSRTEMPKSDSIETNSSQKSKFSGAESKWESSGKIMDIPSVGPAVGHKPSTQSKTHHEKSLPNYAVPRLDLNTKTNTKPDHVSPNTSTRPSTLNVASIPLVNGESFPSDIHLELERSYAEFEAQKQSYENKITELQLQVDYLRRQKNGQLDENASTASISDVTSLYSPYSTPGNSTVTSPSPTPQATPRGSLGNILSPKSPPPPPPPAFVPAPPLVPEKRVKPTKPVVNPKTEMKPLFWNRIVASDESATKGKCIWKNIKEAAIDTNEFERLFSKKTADRKLKRTKSLRDDKHFAHINGKKVVKLLETNRSRAIGIKMSSLNCQLEDIRNAVYNMDTSVVDMESLQSIYDIYPKEEEIQLIQEHMKKTPAVPLDKPEEFMNQLTKMKHFKERLECWLFQDKFSEIIYGIERSLACVSECSNAVTTNAEIATLLGLVLAYGNYMNGNTQRGQADGFHLDVLLKLRDVKAKDSDVNLLYYTVKQYLKQHERGHDKNKNESRLPSPVSLSNAAQVSFDKLKEEILKISKLLDETEVQTKNILDECSPAQRNPFENKMRTFQTTAKQKISEEKEKMVKAEAAFLEAVEYFRWESSEKKETPQEFFGLWAKFIEDVKACVKLEKQQQQIAKKNFSKVEHLNQIREAATKFRKRRQSVDTII